MRNSADFNHEWSGSYFVPRSHILPSPRLQSRVWPELDFWLEAYRNAATTTAPSIEKTKATGAFLDLLVWLRQVLLQDSVFLRKEYPGHPMFQDPIFVDPEYLLFAADLEAACQISVEDSRQVQIEKTHSLIADKLRDLAAAQVARDHRAHKDAIENRSLHAITHKRLDELCRESFTFHWDRGSGRFTVENNLGAPSGPAATTNTAQPTPAAAHPSKPPNNSPDMQNQRRESSRAAVAYVCRAGPSHEYDQSFPRDLTTVQDLLSIWRSGRGSHRSIDYLESNFGSSWRPRADANYFSVRKTIVDEVALRAKSRNRTEQDIAAEMDEQRGHSSLDALSKKIRKERKQL